MGAHLRKLVNINVRYGSSGYCLVMVNIVFGIICTVVVVGLYHYTNIMIPLLLHSNFNISTIQHSIYYCLSICHLISITDTIGLRLTVTVYTLHYTCCC